MRFNVALWNKWLAEFNREPEPGLIKGIEEFRALCNESIAHGSDKGHDAPTINEDQV